MGSFGENELFASRRQHHAGSGAGADTRTDRGAFFTSDNCADERTRAGRAADFGSVFLLCRLGFKAHRLGLNEQLFAVSEDEAIELQSELGAAFDFVGSLRVGDVSPELGALREGFSLVHEDRFREDRRERVAARQLLFITLNREDFSFVIHLDRQPRTSRRREAQTGSRARSGSHSERTLDAVEHSRTLMEWWPFLIFHRGGLRIKVINNSRRLRRDRARELERERLAFCDRQEDARLLTQELPDESRLFHDDVGRSHIRCRFHFVGGSYRPATLAVGGVRAHRGP